MQTFVIAEAGISHCGKLEKAYEAIEVAEAAGADACKFQYFDAKKLAAARGKPELADFLKPYELPPNWLQKLKAKCDEVGVEFMATTYYAEAIADVAPLVKRFKIGHAERDKREFVSTHFPYGKEIVLSSPGTVSATYYKEWLANPCTVTWLYVTEKYPTPIEDVGLEYLHAFQDLPGPDGFSDHTRNVLMGALAVAAGAKIVEVHFEPWNVSHPDSCVSLSPSELAQYIQNIRTAELAVYGASRG